jgi:hypothetical protein
VAESCGRTLTELVEGWSKVPGEANGDPLRAILAGYLSISHCDDPGNGCVLAAPWRRRGTRESCRPPLRVSDPLSSY